jgi:hypothetical protein
MFLVLTIFISETLYAKTKSKDESKPKAKISKPSENKYSTSHSFEGTNIAGRVQQTDLRKIVIENDKSIEDLLGVRAHFLDREKDELERNE